jgi:hypothetical protein
LHKQTRENSNSVAVNNRGLSVVKHNRFLLPLLTWYSHDVAILVADLHEIQAFEWHHCRTRRSHSRSHRASLPHPSFQGPSSIDLSPIIDIPLPSPSIKKTQRETNFLSRRLRYSISRASHPEGCWQRTTVKNSRWRSWLALLLFDKEKRSELRIFLAFVF